MSIIGIILKDEQTTTTHSMWIINCAIVSEDISRGRLPQRKNNNYVLRKRFRCTCWVQPVIDDHSKHCAVYNVIRMQSKLLRITILLYLLLCKYDFVGMFREHKQVINLSSF